MNIPALPEGVARVLATALKQEPAHRFRKVQAFASALAQASGSTPVSSAPSAPQEPPVAIYPPPVPSPMAPVYPPACCSSAWWTRCPAPG